MAGHSSLQMTSRYIEPTAKRSRSLVDFEILLVGPCDSPNFAPHGVVIDQGDAANIFFLSKEFQKPYSSNHDLAQMKGCFGSLMDA